MSESALFVDKAAKRRRLKRRFKLFLIAVATWLGLNAFGAWMLLHPRAARPFIRFEDVAASTRPAAPRPEAVEVETSDGLRLRGTVVAAPAPCAVVLLFHGVGGTRFSAMAERVAEWGYVGVAFDFRGHGESDGSTTTFGFDERRDAEAVVAFARSRWPGKPVGAWGLSMGGAALIFASDATRELDAVVLEAVFTTLDSAFERRVRTFAPAWLSPLAAPAQAFAAWGGGLDHASVRPVDRIGALRPERTLIVTGAKDPWATPEDLAALAAALPGAATHLVPDAEHHDLWRVGGKAYLSRVRAFFDARLR